MITIQQEAELRRTFDACWKLAEDQGYCVLGIGMYSDHPDDTYLAVVLCSLQDGSLVTWIYNKSSNAFGSGHYFRNSYDAQQDFAARISRFSRRS